METLAPPLELLMEIRFGLEKGNPIKKTLQGYISQIEDKNWQCLLQTWLKIMETGGDPKELVASLSPIRRHCLEVLGRGIRGESIYNVVCAMEEEVYKASVLEVDEYIATLPLKSLVPLLFFQFPALILMLVGPLLTSFFSQ